MIRPTSKQRKTRKTYPDATVKIHAWVQHIKCHLESPSSIRSVNLIGCVGETADVETAQTLFLGNRTRLQLGLTNGISFRILFVKSHCNFSDAKSEPKAVSLHCVEIHPTAAPVKSGRSAVRDRMRQQYPQKFRPLRKKGASK